MTDNEIIKALECCSTTRTFDCRQCPYRRNALKELLSDGCFNSLVMDAIDLINRQKAEIEDLNRNLMSAYSKIERLKKGWTADIVITAYAKDETIKEFVDKLCEGRVSNDPVVIAAKCLLKEMTEGNP